MEQNKYKFQIIMSISHFMNYNRGASSISDTLIHVLYILYGIHKQYEIVEEGDSLYFVAHDDKLLFDMFNYFHNQRKPYQMLNLFREISQVPYDDFESIYVDVIKELIESQASYSERYGEFFTPVELTSLIAYFINQDKCLSVFDPFCGTASIVHYFKEHKVSFFGQELHEFIHLLARVNIEARYGEDSNIICADSILQWNSNTFDAVVSCPPFGVQMSVYQSERVKHENNGLNQNLEELFFSRAFELNCAKLVISLEPLSFCYSQKYKEIRRYLIENNYLDTVITLPEKLLYGTSVPCVMIICKRFRDDNLPVRYINAESFFVGDDIKMRSFYLNGFIKTIESDDKTLYGYASREAIVNFDYNLNASLYNYDMTELKEGQETHLLGDLLLDANFVRKHISPLSSYKLYPSGYLKTDTIDIWLSKGKTLDTNYDGRPIANKLYFGDGTSNYLLYSRGASKPRLGLYSGNDEFVCHSGIRVAKINEELVTPEYLVYLIVNHPALKKGNLPLDEYMMLPIAIDNLDNQEAIVAKIKLQYAQRTRAEQEADEKRLGVKQNISDLEHMLGSTQIKINSIIKWLERYDSESADFTKAIKQLRDNVEYMNRIIHYSNADISQESFNMRDQNIVEFINQYADGWRNYGGNYFELEIKNEIDCNQIVAFDKALCTVMLDSILSNALRHSFHKRKDYTDCNRVEISLSMVEYQEKPFVLLSVSNNGDPVPANFTINDYITNLNISY